jgi:hypothetical protein
MKRAAVAIGLSTHMQHVLPLSSPGLVQTLKENEREKKPFDLDNFLNEEPLLLFSSTVPNEEVATAGTKTKKEFIEMFKKESTLKRQRLILL